MESGGFGRGRTVLQLYGIMENRIAIATIKAGERNAVYEAVINLVETRLKKAESLKSSM